MHEKQKQSFGSQGVQKLLGESYSTLHGCVSFDDVGFGVYSEFGEDGMLLYLFSILGHGNRKVVEIGCGNGSQNNSANLIVNHYWNGVLFDADSKNCRAAERFFHQAPSTKLLPPRIVNQFVNPDNVNKLLENEGGLAKGEIDLLSLDIDSIDLWVLEAITIVRPRVIVLEINSRWGPGESMTVPKDGKGAPAYVEGYGMLFAGASLDAFVKLLKPKGYRLVGANHVSTNTFFVREELCDERLPAVSIESVLMKDRAVSIRSKCREKMKDYPWISY